MKLYLALFISILIIPFIEAAHHGNQSADGNKHKSIEPQRFVLHLDLVAGLQMVSVRSPHAPHQFVVL